jgi:hypothetical protein
MPSLLRSQPFADHRPTAHELAGIVDAERLAHVGDRCPLAAVGEVPRLDRGGVLDA